MSFPYVLFLIFPFFDKKMICFTFTKKMFTNCNVFELLQNYKYIDKMSFKLFYICFKA